MNERIKQLLLEAGFKIFGDKIVAGDFGSSGNATLCSQKFAELIVRECINKHRELIARFNKPADGYEHTFPEFMEGVVHGLAEGIEGIEELFEVTVQG